VTGKAGEADDDVLSPQLVDLEPGSAVDDARDYVAYVVRFVGLSRHDGGELGVGAVRVVVALQDRRIVDVV